MPGRKSYGPGGKWIHDRAQRMMDGRKKESLIKRYGESRGKSIAYAIATQQAHKVGKSPKAFRTKAGLREARMKYTKPKKEYRKTAMADVVMAAFADEMSKIAQAPGSIAHRMSLGAESPGAQASISKLVGGGGVGPAPASGGPAPTPPPPPTPGGTGAGGAGMPAPPSAQEMGGGQSAAELGITPGGPPGGPTGTPSASDLGIPGGGPPGGSAPPPASPAPPPPAGGGSAAGSLLSPARQKGPGTGTLSAAESKEVARPSAAEFGG